MFDLRQALVDVLSTGTWSDIKRRFAQASLAWRTDLEPGWGKPKYVARVVSHLGERQLSELADRVLDRFPSDETRNVQDCVWWFAGGQRNQITRVTRLALGDALAGNVLTPTESLEAFCERIAGPRSNAFGWSFGYDHEGRLWESDPFDAKQFRAVSIRDVLESFGFYDWPDHRLFIFLEALVHPERGHKDQLAILKVINASLVVDGFELVELERISGRPVFVVRPVGRGVAGRPKNLIFASNGPKPDIGFRDAVNNDIEVLSNLDSCLVYEEPIAVDGLLWSDLVAWWSARERQPLEVARMRFGERLFQSLASPAEQIFFRTYFECFRDRLGDRLPALIPQVYLHYDPRTLRELYGRSRFQGQRMDFLMLLPAAARVVIEIDGKQHYSDSKGPSPQRYAAMVRADRRLRLVGYEVYRFGGYELCGSAAKEIVEEFFAALFWRHLSNQR